MASLDSTMSADGNTAEVEWTGGSGSFFAQGTFGAGTAKLQWSIDGTNFVDYTAGSLTADGIVTISDLGPCTLRVNLAGATAPDLAVRIANCGLMRG